MTVSDTCDHLADACGTARNFVANDPNATASITQQSSAEIGGQRRWYEALYSYFR